jgi:hypothetical protein
MTDGTNGLQKEGRLRLASGPGEEQLQVPPLPPHYVQGPVGMTGLGDLSWITTILGDVVDRGGLWTMYVFIGRSGFRRKASEKSEAIIVHSRDGTFNVEIGGRVGWREN